MNFSDKDDIADCVEIHCADGLQLRRHLSGRLVANTRTTQRKHRSSQTAPAETLWDVLVSNWLMAVGVIVATLIVGLVTNRFAIQEWWSTPHASTTARKVAVRERVDHRGIVDEDRRNSDDRDDDERDQIERGRSKHWSQRRTDNANDQRRYVGSRSAVPAVISPVAFQNIIEDHAAPPPPTSGFDPPGAPQPNEFPHTAPNWEQNRVPSHAVPNPPRPNDLNTFDNRRDVPRGVVRDVPAMRSRVAEPQFSFNFQNVPWDLVLKRLAQEAGLSLQMATLPMGSFSYIDQNRYSMSEVLDILNDQLLPEGFIVVRSGRSMIVLDAKSEIPENLVLFVSPDELPKLGRHELASVAIPVHNGIAAAAAQEIEKLLSPMGKVVPLSSSQRLLVTDVGTSLRRVHQLMTIGEHGDVPQCSFVYQLRNTPAEEVAKAITEFLAGKRQAAAQAATGANATNRGATRAFTPAATTAQVPLGQVVIAEKTTNSLLVRGTTAEVAEIQKLIVQLDRLPAQVLIQALLVEVELGDTDEFGVELGVQDSVLFDRSVIDKLVTINATNTAPNGVQTTTQNIISQTANPGFNFNNQQLGNNTAINPSKLGSQALSGLGVGRVNGDLGFGGLVLAAGSESISVLLRALQQRYHVDILSRPQIRALDNHEAMIQIGRQVPVVDGVSMSPNGSANPVIRQDQSGSILKVVPRISPDGQVLIDVKAEKSAYQLTPGTGVPIFTDATNGNVIEAPVKDITTATTAVNVRTEQTVVLGGMITRDNINVNRKVPFLGDIPYLGAAFKYKLSEMKRKELLIFLTPIIIQDDGKAEQLKLEEMQRIIMPLEDAQRIHGRIHTPPPGSFGAEGPLCPPFMEPGPQVNPVYTPGQLSSPSQVAPPTSPYSSPYSSAPQGWSTPSAMPAAPAPTMPPEPQSSTAPPPKKTMFSNWRPFSSQRGTTSDRQQQPLAESPETAPFAPATPQPTVNPASYAQPRRR